MNRMLANPQVVTLFQALYNTVSWNFDDGNAGVNQEGQCPSPLTGRRRNRLGLAVAVVSFSSSWSLPASSSAVGPRCRITWISSGSGRQFRDQSKLDKRAFDLVPWQ